MINKDIDAYKTIGEVAEEIALPQHVIRFWETKFSALRPKKINSRRYFSRSQIEIILRIQDLLYNKGFTIAGAVAFLKQEKSSKHTTTAGSNNNSTGGQNASKLQLTIIRNKLQNLQSKLLLLSN